MEKELKLSYIQYYPIGGENAIKIVQLGDEPEILKVNGVIDIDGKLVICANDNNFDYNSDMKLLLRPMSDLCKPLEDGSIPAIELAKLAIKNKKIEPLLVGKKGDVVFDYKIITKPFGKVLKVTNFETWLVYLSFDKPFNVPYFMIEYLFKHHFNVLNLSPDLYIDINTIEK